MSYNTILSFDHFYFILFQFICISGGKQTQVNNESQHDKNTMWIIHGKYLISNLIWKLKIIQ